MNKTLSYIVVITGCLYSIFSFASDKEMPTTPLFQLSAGIANSSVDLTRYEKSIAYRGLHTKITTHIYKPLFFSLEYSSFPIHDLSPNWQNIHTNKLDFNTHVSYSTENNHTRVYALVGANRFLWKGALLDNNNIKTPDLGIMPGNIYKINRWGANCGVGFTHVLYDMIGIIGDCRFTLCNTNSWERIQITDVMTTFGINFSIPYPKRNTSSSLGNKLYKWTKKGAKQ